MKKREKYYPCSVSCSAATSHTGIIGYYLVGHTHGIIKIFCSPYVCVSAVLLSLCGHLKTVQENGGGGVVIVLSPTSTTTTSHSK